MADLPVGSEGSLNGTTAVTILAAPAAATQRIVPKGGASVYLADTVKKDITFQKNKGGTARELQVFKSVNPGETVVLGVVVVLDATNESLEAKSSAAAATTEPKFDVAAMETT